MDVDPAPENASNQFAANNESTEESAQVVEEATSNETINKVFTGI